jgi:hypothetical protein
VASVVGGPVVVNQSRRQVRLGAAAREGSGAHETCHRRHPLLRPLGAPNPGRFWTSRKSPKRRRNPSLGQTILREDNTLRLWDASWQGDDLFEIVCKYTPMMSSMEEIERLSKRYGVKIAEPICQLGVKIPGPDWSRTERAHAE